MNHIGQAITWGTFSAPRVFSGRCTGHSLRDAITRQLFDTEKGDYIAAAMHSRKAELSFSAEVTNDSTDFLDLSPGPLITVDGIEGGALCASRAVETWRLGQRKSASVQATWFPNMATTGGVAAGTDLSAFTPDQTGIGIVDPAGVLIYGTFGLTHTGGIVHELEITQQWTLQEDDPSPVGTILGVTPINYMRTLRLLLLITGALPAVKSTLTITGAPAHAADHRIESVEPRFEDRRGKVCEINAFWIPPFTE